MAHKENKPQNWFDSDEKFNSLYPPQIQQVAKKHWTPLEVAKQAAAFIAISPDEKVLDIGSGAGKFCLTAAHYHPHVPIYGIEQRAELVDLCNGLKEKLQLDNVNFIHGNISLMQLDAYDHFYFYNAFYENVTGTEKIDDNIVYSEKLYDYYNRYLYRQLDKKPQGTRLVTYHSFGSEVPPGFTLLSSGFDDYLKFWVKEK